MKIKYKPWAKVLMYLVEAIVIILSVFPILWVIMSSFFTLFEYRISAYFLCF